MKDERRAGGGNSENKRRSFSIWLNCYIKSKPGGESRRRNGIQKAPRTERREETNKKHFSPAFLTQQLTSYLSSFSSHLNLKGGREKEAEEIHRHHDPILMYHPLQKLKTKKKQESSSLLCHHHHLRKKGRNESVAWASAHLFCIQICSFFVSRTRINKSKSRDEKRRRGGKVCWLK